MRFNKLAVAAVMTTVVAAAGVAWWVIDDSATLGTYLENNGFVRVEPPSKLYGPGTINTVETLKDGSIVLWRTCTLDEESERELVDRVLVSDTVDHAFEGKVGGRFDAKLFRLLAQLAQSSTGIEGGLTQDVQFQLSNVRVVSMPYDALLQFEHRLITGACEEAIIANLRQGAMVCQTQAVLQADFKHHITRSKHVDTVTKVDGQGPGLTLASGGSHDQDLQTLGEDLFLGVRLRNYETGCIKLPEQAL